ncbi:MAG: helix-turn-helix domain-containing protein [Bryobacteraceae bacterium]|jgi:AraC-like DNA-binding protein
MTNEELKELQAIKKLLALQLIEQGMSPSKIADALGMSHSQFNAEFGSWLNLLQE